jgi:GNAT superfamily N-acetyltransferase
MPIENQVRQATGADIDTMCDALVKSFADDPVMMWVFKTPATRAKKSRALFVTSARRALVKGAAYVSGDPARGGAIWLAPGNWKTAGLELLKDIPMLFHLGADVPRGLSLINTLEKAHPTEPHWYLEILGTDPAHQGKGVGSAMLTPILSRCDEDGIPAYLESSKEKNIPFYNRHGFQVTGELRAKDSPTLWSMWRDPQR